MGNTEKGRMEVIYLTTYSQYFEKPFQYIAKNNQSHANQISFWHLKICFTVIKCEKIIVKIISYDITRDRCNESSDRSFMVDPLSYFSFRPVLHDWCNKGHGMRYPVCGMVHIKEPLLLIDKSSLCGGSGFPFSLSEWSLTICLMPYNLK